MDLAYNPGELVYKNDKEMKHDLEHKNDRELKESVSGLKRDHDSVDDFEHLDPDSSPVDMPFDSKSLTTTTKSLKSDLDKNDEVPKSDEFSFGNGFSNGKDLLSDINLESHQPKKDSVEINLKTNQMDFEITSGNHPMTVNTEQDNALNLNFISAEKAVNSKKTDSESDLIGLETSDKETGKIIEVVHDVPTLPKEAEDVSGFQSKSMKEADAMSHYDLKLDKIDFGMKDDQTDLDVKNAPELNKDSEVISPSNLDSEDHEVADKEMSNSKDLETKEELSSSHPKPEPLEPKPFLNKPPSPKDPVKEKPTVLEESKDFPPADDIFQHRVCICPSKPEASVADLGLDDIIGPEDVFKRFGLVEALVYWRDPKKSGAVFGVVMAILVSLCFFSLISVLAYTSLFALVGAINFRIYKNILQAVQKTSEGHPFKEYLDMELSLPQDKVREMTDTAVVHINAAIVELRRLFLVEDLIDSMKFAVCLWCFTYVGAIFNGMTLVILAFVALFTVPKIYENNKASIDTYIEMGRSKVAEITSKVKAAVPIGKKEPEKDKEQ